MLLTEVDMNCFHIWVDPAAFRENIISFEHVAIYLIDQLFSEMSSLWAKSVDNGEPWNVTDDVSRYSTNDWLVLSKRETHLKFSLRIM